MGGKVLFRARGKVLKARPTKKILRKKKKKENHPLMTKICLAGGVRRPSPKKSTPKSVCTLRGGLGSIIEEMGKFPGGKRLREQGKKGTPDPGVLWLNRQPTRGVGERVKDRVKKLKFTQKGKHEQE